jgi:hypothetical protein
LLLTGTEVPVIRVAQLLVHDDPLVVRAEPLEECVRAGRVRLVDLDGGGLQLRRHHDPVKRQAQRFARILLRLSQQRDFRRDQRVLRERGRAKVRVRCVEPCHRVRAVVRIVREERS